ncbi:MAG: serine hydrolase [Bacteroidia bacterium]|nr:serine hydrolase [Bacteroidia bacterium]
MKRYFILVLIAIGINVKSQTIYFPSTSDTTWDVISPQSLNWCEERIDSLYNYLQIKNTKSFILLKDGKIVLEKYFGTYSKDSVHYWASAGKSLTGFLAGVAQQKGLIDINNKVSQYIGSGWTSAPLAKENLITVKNLLTMTSGLDESPPLPCSSDDTAKACLNYLVDAGTRWAYHSGAYKKLQSVISIPAGMSYNQVTDNWLESHIGMNGLWFQQVYYSKARDMARFGLLILNKGIWNTDTILKDSVYFKNMTNTSQTFNKSYGYLWWLNGKPTYMNPGIQLVLTGPLVPNCPPDMFAGLGKNDQKIYVVPSTNMVVIRQGNSADGVTFALSTFDNKLWDYINKLVCVTTGVNEKDKAEPFSFYPNPADETININTNVPIRALRLSNCLGQLVEVNYANNKIDVSNLQKGFYFITITTSTDANYTKKIVIN